MFTCRLEEMVSTFVSLSGAGSAGSSLQQEQQHKNNKISEQSPRACPEYNNSTATSRMNFGKICGFLYT
jgi:hypothetical protein